MNTSGTNSQDTPALSTVDVMRAAAIINQMQSLLAMDLAMMARKGLTIKLELATGSGVNPTLYLPVEELESWITEKTANNLDLLSSLGVSAAGLLADFKQQAETILAKQQS